MNNKDVLLDILDALKLGWKNLIKFCEDYQKKEKPVPKDIIFNKLKLDPGNKLQMFIVGLVIGIVIIILLWI